MVTRRRFDPSRDIEHVSRFLQSCYKPLNQDGNWIQPIWDYSCFHPVTELESQKKLGIWVADGKIVAATVCDLHVNNISLCTSDAFRSLKTEMLDYAEENLTRTNSKGEKRLNVFVHESDEELNELLLRLNYIRRPEEDRTFSSCDISKSEIEIPLPDGFKFKSLEEENDLKKIHRVLWRGFDHSGEPPEEGIEDRKLMQSSPNFRFDLTMVNKTPSGDYAVYCGMWYDDKNRYCYVEPVATDPDYRRRGLGKATVLESMRRCGLLGAEIAYVWTDTPFYRSMGFNPLFKHYCWTKACR